MQNQPLVDKISTLLREIKSNEIMEFLSKPSLDRVKLLTLIIESKIVYERGLADVECSNIIEEIEEHRIYDEGNYNKLVTYISNLGAPSQNAEADLKLLLWFRHFHIMLIKTCNVVVKLMSNHQYVAMPLTSNVINDPLSKPPLVQPIEKEEPVRTEPKIVNMKAKDDEDDLNLNAFLKSISLV